MMFDRRIIRVSTIVYDSGIEIFQSAEVLMTAAINCKCCCSTYECSIINFHSRSKCVFESCAIPDIQYTSNVQIIKSENINCTVTQIIIRILRIKRYIKEKNKKNKHI